MTAPDALAVELERHPWEPVALDPSGIAPPPAPTILPAAAGGALLYVGARHILQGEAESLKSWIAAACAVDVMRNGLTVLWWDADEMGQAALAERLLALGASPEMVRARLLYLAPDAPLDRTGRLLLDDLLAREPLGLVVIDALNPAMELWGLDPSSNPDVQRFLRELVGLFHGRGIATLATDHVVKDSEARGRYGYGSERKTTGADVVIGTELRGPPMTREHPQGRVLLRAQKDRPGWHRRGDGRRIGELAFDLAAAEPWTLTLLDREAERGPWRPTGYMERASRAIEETPDLSVRQVVERVGGKSPHVQEAVAVLVREGFVVTEPGPRKAILHRSARPYREADDQLVRDPPHECVPPCPECVPDTVTTVSRPTGPLPEGGTPRDTVSEGGAGGASVSPATESRNALDPPAIRPSPLGVDHDDDARAGGR